MNQKIFYFLVALVLCRTLTALADEPPSYKLATQNYQFQFPRDHGSHPTYQTEWWYFTGQLWKDDEKQFQDKPAFGFQLTFFRRAQQNKTEWGQSYMAHAALSDFTSQKFLFSKRLARGGLHLAGADEARLNTWHRDWSAEQIADSIVVRYSLTPEEAQDSAGQPAATNTHIQLIADSATNPILQGEAGYSQKGNCTQCASLYYSFPRLKLRGQVVIDGKSIPVHGLGWMDHEFMSNALETDQVGWDWFSLMRNDGLSLMLFQLRTADGKQSFGSGSVIDAGHSKKLDATEFSLVPGEKWRSTATGAQYPIEWHVTVPSINADAIVRARIPNQELTWKSSEKDSIAYYEGAVSDKEERMLGYVEMTGYAGSLENKL